MAEQHEDYMISTVDIMDHAKLEIDTARSEGVDPWDIYKSHVRVALAIQKVLDSEGKK